MYLPSVLKNIHLYKMNFLILICLLKIIEGANILVFLGSDLRSHLNSLHPIIANLAPYHNISFFVNKVLKYKYENVTTFHTPTLSATKSLTEMKILNAPCKISNFKTIYKYTLHQNKTYFDEVYSDENIKNLMKSKGKYDLIIINIFGSEHYTFLAHHLDIPLIAVFPSYLSGYSSDIGSTPDFQYELGFSTSENEDYILSRTQNFIISTFLRYRYYEVHFKVMDKVILPYFLKNTPTISEILFSRMELIFSNSHFAIGTPRAASPLVIEVGGMHISPPKALPDDLEEFLNSAPHGVIYFSLGSVIQGENLQHYVIEAILRTFGKMKQKILWKWNGTMDNIPKNVKLGSWFPQQDILRHKNVKLFITQGGRLSMIESLYYGVPLLMMPVIFDQHSNGRLAERQHFGLSLDFCHFTEKLFDEKIQALINNPKYKQHAEQISEILQDGVKNIHEKINFWVNFVLKNKGKSTLKTIKKYSWLQIVPTDIFLILTIFITLFIVMFLFIIKCTYLYILKIKLKID